jgi:iron complex transport system substrate-binding protein
MPLESLLKLLPDLVLDAGTADATYISATERLARQTGLPCVLIQGSLADHARQLREVGALLGEAARGETLACHADAVAALAQRSTQGMAPAERPRVYFARSANGLETGLAGSINVEAVEYAGGCNVAADAGRGGLTRVSMEQILAWDPQVIVTQEPGLAERMRQDPLWRGVAAVRSGRVHCAPVWPFGWLDGPPGVNRLIGVRWLLEKLHPQAPALQGLPPLEREVRDFYRLFYGADLSPTALGRLMETAR